MKIGDDEVEYDVEYLPSELEDVEIYNPPRFWTSDYYDFETHTMLPGAPEELKKEYAAFARRELEMRKNHICM